MYDYYFKGKRVELILGQLYDTHWNFQIPGSPGIHSGRLGIELIAVKAGETPPEQSVQEDDVLDDFQLTKAPQRGQLKPNELRRLAEFFATYEIYSLAASYDHVNLPAALKECTDGGWEPSPAFSKAVEEAIERHGLDGIWIVGDSDTYHPTLEEFLHEGREPIFLYRHPKRLPQYPFDDPFDIPF